MSISQESFQIANVDINVVRKDIKRMHLAVYPPEGRIRLAAPLNSDTEVLRLFVISKLSWIKKHVRNFQNQEREASRSYVSGESHFFMGKRYLLKVIPGSPKNEVAIKGTKTLELRVWGNPTRDQKANIIKTWYRKELKALLPQMIEKWESIIQVKCMSWNVRQMRTKWGSCNTDKGSILLNLELVKKPKNCLEYIVVHELVHLLERHHNDAFVKHMDTFMPKWRHHRDELNSLPVLHNDWGY